MLQIHNTDYHLGVGNFNRFTISLTDEERNILLKTIDYEILSDPMLNVFPHQTKSNMHIKYEKEWSFLLNKITECMHTIDKKASISTCWGNVSKEDNRYGEHTHKSAYTCVYYLQNNLPEYGTTIYKDIILKGTQGTCVIMSGKIPHSVTNMPENIARDNTRYSIAIDYDIVMTETDVSNYLDNERKRFIEEKNK